MENKINYPFNVFISYKIDPFSDAIDSVVSRLLHNHEKRLHIYASKANKLGSPWREEIHQELMKADLLVLLYLDKDEKYDFCFYETGFLCGASANRKIKIITVTSPNVEIPHPVSGWDGTVFSYDGIKKLLDSIYNDDDKPVWEPTNDRNILENRNRDIESNVEFILENLSPVSRKSINPRLQFIVSSSQMDEIYNGKVPENIKMHGESQAFKDLRLDFNNEIEIDEFIEKLKRVNKEEKVEMAMEYFTPHLLETFININEGVFNGNTPPPIRLYGNSANVLVPTDVVQKIDYKTEKTCEYRFEFLVHENPTAFNREQDSKINKVHNLYTTSQHFKWRVIDKWSDKFKNLSESPNIKKEDLIKNIHLFRLDLYRSLLDSHNRKFNYSKDVINLFDDESDINYLKETIGKEGSWYTLYGNMLIAMEENNIEDLIHILSKIKEINKKVLLMTTSKLNQLIMNES